MSSLEEHDAEQARITAEFEERYAEMSKVQQVAVDLGMYIDDAVENEEACYSFIVENAADNSALDVADEWKRDQDESDAESYRAQIANVRDASHWQVFEGHSLDDWRMEIENDETRLGYKDWVINRLTAESDEEEEPLQSYAFSIRVDVTLEVKARSEEQAREIANRRIDGAVFTNNHTGEDFDCNVDKLQLDDVVEFE